MDYENVFKILENRRESVYRVEYKDEEGYWWELFKDQPIRMIYEFELRIVKK